MAISVPLMPFDLGNNDCYSFLLDSFRQEKSFEWDVSLLLDEFGKLSTSECLSLGILLRSRNERARLSFCQAGSTTNLIVRSVSKNLLPFHDVLASLPRSCNCSSRKLKNYLAFLENFSQIQFVNDPVTGLTIVAPDSQNGCSSNFELALDALTIRLPSSQI